MRKVDPLDRIYVKHALFFYDFPIYPQSVPQNVHMY